MDNANILTADLRNRIEFDENIFGDVTTYNKVISRLLEDSTNVALSLRYPYKDFSEMELPKKYNNWILRCAEEIYQGIGNQGIKSYSENGLAWTRDSGYVSYELRSEIEPVVGYIEIEGDNNV